MKLLGILIKVRCLSRTQHQTASSATRFMDENELKGFKKGFGRQAAISAAERVNVIISSVVNQQQSPVQFSYL